MAAYLDLFVFNVRAYYTCSYVIFVVWCYQCCLCDLHQLWQGHSDSNHPWLFSQLIKKVHAPYYVKTTSCRNMHQIDEYNRGSRGGEGGSAPPPLEFAKLNIADITGNDKK